MVSGSPPTRPFNSTPVSYTHLKRGTVTPSEPSAPPAAETKYLSVKIVLGEGAGTIGGVDLENVSFTLSNGEKEVACTVNPKSSTTTGMEYATGKTYSIKEGSISDNSGMYTLGDITSTVENADSENPTLVLKIGELTPKVGTISGAASIKALSEVKYTLDNDLILAAPEIVPTFGVTSPIFKDVSKRQVSTLISDTTRFFGSVV